MTRLTDYINKRVNHPDQFNAVTPQPKSELPDNFVQAPQNVEIDTTDALGSLVGMLETPAEREAKERRLLEHRNKMQMWFGLFDGLRQLGNLYATAKGASPQNLTSTAPVIDQQYQQNRQLINGLGNYRNNYAQQLYNLHRQQEMEKRAQKKLEADLDWYKTRDEMARLKAENEKLKAEAAARTSDARTKNIEAKTETEETLRPGKQSALEAQTQQRRASAHYSNTRAANVGKSGKGKNKKGSTSEKTKVDW